jgi:hypothetical protein
MRYALPLHYAEPAEREFLRRRGDDAARHGGLWPPAAE